MSISMYRKRFIAICLTGAAIGLYACKGKTTGQGERPAVSMEKFILAYEQNKKIQLLDVRTPDEYATGHVPGAVLLPLDQVLAGESIPFDKNSEIYIICRSGSRSLKAAHYLENNGYKNVRSVDGGTMDWIVRGKPVN
ncbi:MAG: rhodanese-like domain-containing protein [Spirochaetia bacterium]|nr:rhodanese-like domain-containing protein [Spirochaetia bacterium]